MPRGVPDAGVVAALIDQAALEAVRIYDKEKVPTLPASDEGLEAEFYGGVYRYARQWLIERGGAVVGGKPCVFVLSRSIGQDVERFGAEVVPYFASCSDADVSGKVFVANDDLSIVAEVPGHACGNPMAVAKSLGELGLADAAHAMFRPDRSEMIIAREGVLGKNSCVSIDCGVTQRFSQIDLERAIWRFHRSFTQTPSGYLLCWRGSPSDRVTIEQLERQISGLLAFYLGSIVGSDHVGMEHYTSHGRLDVKVSGEAMLPGVGPCALELKVLRSRQASSGKKKWTAVSALKMIQHASEGIQQAVEYRQDIGAGTAYLCCFDARFQDQDQLIIQNLAAENDVTLRRYFMYDSPATHRTAAATAKRQGQLLSGEVN